MVFNSLFKKVFCVFFNGFSMVLNGVSVIFKGYNLYLGFWTMRLQLPASLHSFFPRFVKSLDWGFSTNFHLVFDLLKPFAELRERPRRVVVFSDMAFAQAAGHGEEPVLRKVQREWRRLKLEMWLGRCREKTINHGLLTRKIAILVAVITVSSRNFGRVVVARVWKVLFFFWIDRPTGVMTRKDLRVVFWSSQKPKARNKKEQTTQRAQATHDHKS